MRAINHRASHSNCTANKLYFWFVVRPARNRPASLCFIPPSSLPPSFPSARLSVPLPICLSVCPTRDAPYLPSAPVVPVQSRMDPAAPHHYYSPRARPPLANRQPNQNSINNNSSSRSNKPVEPAGSPRAFLRAATSAFPPSAAPSLLWCGVETIAQLPTTTAPPVPPPGSQ